MMKRRSFLIGLGALVTAPMIVRAEALMPVKVMLPSGPLLLHVDPGALEGITMPAGFFRTIQEALDYAAAMKSERSEIVLASGNYQNTVAIAPIGEHTLVSELGNVVDLSNAELRFQNRREPIIHATTLSVIDLGNTRMFSQIGHPDISPGASSMRATYGACLTQSRVRYGG
jgi:hypothetical protein